MSPINITRRALFGQMAAAGSALAVTPAFALPAHDPMLETLTQYRRHMDFCNGKHGLSDEQFKAYLEENIDPVVYGIIDNPPLVTTKAGAVMAIQCATDDAMIQDCADVLLEAAIAFLERV